MQQLLWNDRGAGQPVVFVNAFPLDARMWERQAEALSADARVLTIDFPGFGANRDAEPCHSLDECTEILAWLLREAGIGKAVFAGCSLGGYILFALMRRHPEIVSALVLSDTRPGGDSPEARATRLRQAAEVRARGMQPLIDAMLPKFFDPAAGAARAGLESIVTAMMNTTRPEGAASMLEAMAARPDSTAELASYRVPTCIVTGLQDALIPPVEARAMHAGIAGSVFTGIENCGHLPSLEAPDELTRIIGAFLRSIG